MDVDAVRPGEDVPAWSEALLLADAGEEWVVVHRDYDTHKRVEITCAMLLDAGVPARLHPEPFAGKWQGQFLWGDLFPIRLLVPTSRVEDARGLLSAAFEDEDGAFAVAGDEVAEARAGRGWYASVSHAWANGAIVLFLILLLLYG